MFRTISILSIYSINIYIYITISVISRTISIGLLIVISGLLLFMKSYVKIRVMDTCKVPAHAICRNCATGRPCALGMKAQGLSTNVGSL